MAQYGLEDVDWLRREIDRAMQRRVDQDRVIPLVVSLARIAKPESDAWIMAHRYLAEVCVEKDPWRAAILVRRILRVLDTDDGSWALLGLAQSLLGNYRYAARAYQRALALAPHNPWYAHNLGHLLDVAFDRPFEALPLLAKATAAKPHESEIVASFAHALARCGQLSLAKKIFEPTIRNGPTSDQMTLWRWLDAGAPCSDQGHSSPWNNQKRKVRLRQCNPPGAR